MISEIQIIKSGGLPLYHYTTEDASDAIKILQASFFTALTSFADELKNGETKLIVMEKKSYLLKRSMGYTLLFSSLIEGHEDNIRAHESDLNDASEYLAERMNYYNIDPDSFDTSSFDRPLTDLDQFLKDIGLIPKDKGLNVQKFRTNIQSAIFKSVGYQPGVCNIGRGERFRRLSFGMTWLVISFALYSAIEIMNLNNYFKLLLIIPNFLGFLGVLQYFYRFCTTNAMKEIYNMN